MHNEEPTPATARSVRRANAIAIGLLLIGLLPMIGYTIGNLPMRGIGLALGMAPFPKVFSDVDGMEPYASEFVLHYETPGEGADSLTITPAVYHRLGGPYNRRNVYGAALSYAPRLPDTLWQTVFCYGMTGEAPLRRELGLPDDIQNVKVEIRTNTRNRDDSWLLEPICAA